MFDSTRNVSAGQRSRFGVGTVISVAVHAGLIALVVVLTTRPAEVKPEEPKLTFVRPTPLKRQSSPRLAVATATAQQRPAVRRDRIIPPKVIPTHVEPVVDQPPTTSEPSVGTVIGVGNDGPGDGTGSPIGDSDVGTDIGTPGNGGPDTVESFVAGMTRPVVDREELVRNLYTREAREAGVHGSMIIACQVLADGSVRACHAIRPLPLLTDAVISRLEQSRVQPAMLQGAPVSVNYVFNFQFTMP
jgi:protein TonB